MQQTEINQLLIIIVAQIILAIIITKTGLFSSDKKESVTKTIIIIIILFGLSLTLATIQNKSFPTSKQAPIQSVLSSMQESDCTQKEPPQENIEKDKKTPSENQQPSPSETQKNTTQEIINKIESKKKYIIVSNQYAQTLNSFLETHCYKKVATTPDGNLYEYQRPQFGFR